MENYNNKKFKQSKLMKEQVDEMALSKKHKIAS